jgi:MFS transporter, BCD family, chlorophyll transporter
MLWAMYVMLLLGSVISAIAFGWFLENFSPGRLVQVIQGTAMMTILLNALALWKQEPLRRASPEKSNASEPSFSEAWASYMTDTNAMRRLIIIGLGTMAFGMQDVLLEPYGGEILELTVSATTYLTATLAAGGLLGFGLASYILNRGGDPFRMSASGAALGLLAFFAVIASAEIDMALIFKLGVFVLGAGGGLFGHGTLTASMNAAPKEQAGLALGAWGAVQATAAGLGIGLGGVIRDLVLASPLARAYGPVSGYHAVYVIEVILLLATLAALYPLVRRPNTGLSAYHNYSLGQQ